MRTGDFDYHLPPELIAQTPLKLRDSSRLMVLDRTTGALEHRHFTSIPEYLRPGDVMVFNRSRVIPARLRGYGIETGGKVELLLLQREGPGIWRALAKPARRLRPGAKVVVERRAAEAAGPAARDGPPLGGSLSTSLSASLSEQRARREFIVEILASHADGIKTLSLGPEEEMDLLGEMPLPPYIREPLEDPERYQTVFATVPGSAAAPTAGLHFTEGLMAKLRRAGVQPVFLTLHVGLDTFRPVREEDPTRHKIHTEYFELGDDAAEVLNRAQSSGSRIIAVGTTVVRTLEQAAKLASGNGVSRLEGVSGQADLFILPGHKFRVVDALITNFHLPRSTLLMLVSAFAGRERVLEAYREAIERKYRFYSFGDAMLVL